MIVLDQFRPQNQIQPTPSRLTPAVVKQEVNFLDSSEISLHRTTVNLKTHRGLDWTTSPHARKHRILDFLFSSLGQDGGLGAAGGEQDHLGQLVEQLDGPGRQLSQTPDGRGVDLLPTSPQV